MEGLGLGRAMRLDSALTARAWLINHLTSIAIREFDSLQVDSRYWQRLNAGCSELCAHSGLSGKVDTRPAKRWDLHCPLIYHAGRWNDNSRLSIFFGREQHCQLLRDD